MASSTRFHDIEVKGVIRTSQTGALIGLVTSLPTASAKNKGCAVLYDDTVYLSDGSSWVSQGKIVDVDATVTDGSENPVSGDAVFEKLKSYATTSNAIKALSASGTTITYTKADGTTGTITTQDTDTKVTQTNSTGTSAYPILLKNGTGTGSVTSTTLFDDGVTVQPSTGTITATKLVGVTSDAVNAGKHYTITVNSSDYKQMIAISAADYIANGRGAHMKIACVCKSTVNTSVRHSFIADIIWAGVSPDCMVLNSLPSANANSGVYTLRILAPKSDSYGCSVDVRGYDANARIVDLAILESDVPYTVTLNPVTNIYNSSHYNYWQFNTGQYNQMIFSNDIAGTSNIMGRSNSTWDSILNDRFRFGESVAAGNIVAIASDNLTYKLANTSVAFRLPIKMVSSFSSYTTTSNYGAGYHTVRGVALTILSGQGLSVPSSYSIGDSLYLVGTLDSNGNFVSDATVSTSMVKGKTNIRFGKVEWLNSTTPTHYSFDAFGTNAYTLDANGKLTHIDGVAVLPGSANALTVNGGSSTKPVYFKDGVPTECGSTLDVDVSGTAADAVILTNARTIDGVSFNGSANITHFGTCSTAAATVAKTVAITGFTLATGARALIKFTVTNTAASPTLNINGTGAKAIQYRGAAISAGYLAANRTYEFVYDGTNYQLVGDLNTDGDTKVTQTNSTAATAYPILLKNGTGTGSVTDSVLFDDGVTITPSTGTVKATAFDGLATKATSDGNGKNIANTYATKDELKAAATSALVYKGSVATYGDLPTSGNTTGDVYNVVAEYGTVPAGTNWAWNGSEWDPLGGSVDLSKYVLAETGKGLSTNDFTDSYKTKLDGIATTYQTKSVGTANRALVSDSSGNIGVSAVTSTELGYLDGVTSNVQTQLNNKENVKTPKTYNIPSDGKWYEVARIAKADFASAGYNAYARILCGSDTTNVSGIRHVFVADVTWARGKLANTTTAEWFIQNNCPTVNSNNSGIYAFRVLQPNANKDYDIIIELYARYASGDATHYTVPAEVTVMDSNVPVTMLSAPVASTYNSANHNNLAYNVGQFNYHVSSNTWAGDITGRSGSSWDTLFNDRFKTGATVVAISGTSKRAIRNAYLSAVNSSGFLQHLQTPDVAFKLPLEGGRPIGDFNINATYAQVANRIRGIVNTELTAERTIDSSSTISASTRYYTKYLIDGGTTFKIGLPLFLKGSLDASGNFVPYYTKTTKTVDSVNYNLYTFYIYSSMQNGATNVLIGNGDHDTTHYTVHYGAAYTLDSSGNLTHIDGKPILDSKVTQTNSTSNTAYPILLKNGTGTGTVTTGALFDDGVTINPSTGTISATNLTLSGDIWVDEVNGNRYAGMVSEKRENITGLTLDLNTLTLSDGVYHIRKFIEATSGGAANITNLPVTGQPFILDVELVRWAGTSDFVTRQTFASNTQPAYDYVRWCTNGTWGSWTKRVYTDTDTKVTQTNSTSNTAYPVLLKNGTGTGTTTTTALFNSTVTINPSTLRMAGLKGIDYTPGTNTWVGALQGNSAIMSTAPAGNFSPLLAFKTTNGSMGVGCHQTRLQIYYAAKATVDAGNNNMAKMATLMDESGNASWPGSITASSGFIGNASSATKATQDGNGNVIADTYTKTVSGSSLSVTWASDTSVSGYKYKGTISLTGVTSSHIPVVTFDNAQARSGNYCPVAESGTNVIYIWSKVNTTITIPSVMAVLP